MTQGGPSAELYLVSMCVCVCYGPTGRGTRTGHACMCVCYGSTGTAYANRARVRGVGPNHSLYRVAGGCGLEHTINSH
eukprot:3097940-Prymnesium_polylepis.1